MKTNRLVQQTTENDFEPKYRIYGFSSGSDSRPEWCLNQTKRIFNGVAERIGCFGRTKPVEQTFRYRYDIDVINYAGYLRNGHFAACSHAIEQSIEFADLVIIQSYGSNVKKTALEIEQEYIRGDVEFNYDDTKDCMSLLISMHIMSCFRLNKPFMLYTFDPVLDWNYGINRMHGFVEHPSLMRYFPLLEASLTKPLKYNNAKKSIVYGGKLSTFDNKFDARNDFHKEIAKTLSILSNSTITVECTSTAGTKLYCIGGRQSFDNENDYFRLLDKHQFTIVPPNYTNQVLSIKRAIDALEHGSVPVVLCSDLDSTPYLRLERVSNLVSLEGLDTMIKKESFETIANGIKRLDIWFWIKNYINIWTNGNFVQQYVPFMFKEINEAVIAAAKKGDSVDDVKVINTDLNAIRDAVYQLALKQGKYDGKPAVAPLLMHTVGEVNEAHAAYMSNRRAQQEDIEALKSLLKQGNMNVFRKYFKSSIKSTFEDELADIMLMVFSISGYYGIDIATHVDMKNLYNSVRDEHSDTNDYNKR